ncbi:hypothetical protein U1Q18_026014 [Sarracenia purpurea var. burkii]
MLPTSRHGQIKSRTTTLGQCDNGGSGAWRRRRGVMVTEHHGVAPELRWLMMRGVPGAPKEAGRRGCGLEDGFPDFGGFRA